MYFLQFALFSCFLPYPSLRFSSCALSVWFWLWLHYLDPVAVGPFDWAVEDWRRSPARALGTGWFCRFRGRSRRSPALTDRQLSSAGDTIYIFFTLESQKRQFLLKSDFKALERSNSYWHFKFYKPDWLFWHKPSFRFGIQHLYLDTADVRYMWRWRNFIIMDSF